MAGTFKFKIITPERVVIDTEVEQVTATARDGQLSILPHHEPLVTALGIDILRYVERGEEHSAAIIGGILEVSEEDVVVLSDAGELGIEIDEARANKAKERAEVEKMQKADKLDTHMAELALAKAMARLRAAELAEQRKHRSRRGG